MGLSCLPSRVPLLLVMLAHAQRSGRRLGTRGSVFLEDTSCEVLSIERPDRSLQHVLTACEWAVTRLLVEGKTHAQIAALRGTSVRTTANQLASSFEQLRVSGRSELLRLIADPDALQRATARRRRAAGEPLPATLPTTAPSAARTPESRCWFGVQPDVPASASAGAASGVLIDSTSRPPQLAGSSSPEIAASSAAGGRSAETPSPETGSVVRVRPNSASTARSEYPFARAR